VRELLNSLGAVTDTYAYDAFGNTVAQTGSTVNEFLYRGEQFDTGLGMYYLRARYYVPRTGRFLTQDIETGTAGKPITQHKYIYAYADPANGIDPSGHGAILDTAKLVILTVLASPAFQEAGEEARGLLSLAENSWLRANEYYEIFFENATRWGDIIRGTQNVVASGQFLDKAGNVIRATAVSGNRWIPALRAAVKEAGEVDVEIPWDEAAEGAHHAEQLLVQWAQQNGYRILSIAAAGQDICDFCYPFLEGVSAAQQAAYGFGFPFIL
jgi:RHS repeat-associated protein